MQVIKRLLSEYQTREKKKGEENMAKISLEMAKEQAKRRLEEYLRDKGIDTSKNFKCLNSDHDDKTPSMSFDRERNKIHCFGCGVDWDIFDLVAHENNLSTSDAFKRVFQMFNIDVENFSSQQTQQTQQTSEVQKPVKNGRNTDLEVTEHNEKENENMNKKRTMEMKNKLAEYFELCHLRVNETDYFKRRGLSDEIIERFKLGYDPRFKVVTGKNACEFWEAVIIPTGEYSFTVRNINSKEKGERYRKHGQQQLFSLEALYTGWPVFIVEGEIDALSILEADLNGQFGAVALGSTSFVKKFLDTVRDKPPHNMLIISLDHDEEGKAATEALEEGLKELGIPYQITNIFGDYKDANEALVKDRENFKSIVIETAIMADYEFRMLQNAELTQYKKQNALSYMVDDFVQEIINSKNNLMCIQTGFSYLDAMLEGGLYEGLYILGALTSLGKTTFALQIADQIARCGYDVLFFTMEMAKAELMAKSISRLTLELAIERDKKVNLDLAKTARGITSGVRYVNYSEEEKNVIKEAIDRYRKYSEQIYMIEGVGEVSVRDIREKVENHIRITKKYPIVIIDYLQAISPFDPRFNDKQNTDKAVIELKRISRDYKIPIFAISSLNRQSYLNAVSYDSFKESGIIEYSSDVLLGMQYRGVGKAEFNIKTEREKEPREIELAIIKNRNGASGSVYFDYYARFNYFVESTTNGQ